MKKKAGKAPVPSQRVENSCIDPGDAKKGEIQIVSEETVWENDSARLLVARVQLLKSNEFKEHFRLAHAEGTSDGVIIVPITNDDRIVLIRQFRHPVRMWLRELPRGASKEGETPSDAARRELKEEIGAEAVEIFALGRVVTDSGQQVGHPHIVAARVREGGRAEPETSEAIDGTFKYTYAELAAACERGEIIDSFTLAAVVRLRPHFESGRFVYRAGVVAS